MKNLSENKQLHKITCMRCRGITYLDYIPDVFVCGCIEMKKGMHPGMKWCVCPNCGVGSLHGTGEWFVRCKTCEDQNSRKIIGTINTGEKIREGDRLANMSISSLFGDKKTESMRQTDLLEKILKHLEKENKI